MPAIRCFKSFFTLLGLLLAALCAAPAQAASLRFGVSSLTPAAQPQVEVVVSGATVFNAVTTGFTTPVNTTGHVVIRIRALPDYQVFEGWTGVCAGVRPELPCEFDAGLDTTYDAGAVIRNRVGTLRFTATSVDLVRPPTAVQLTLNRSPEGASGDLAIPVGPSAPSLTLVVGSYAYTPHEVLNFDCFQAPTLASLSALVEEGRETIVNVEYRGDRCAVAVEADVNTNGTVTSTPAGIDCPFGTVIAPGSSSVCAAFFPLLSTARLQPVPKAGFVFAGWTGCRPALQRVCEAVAQPSVSAKRPAFVAAGAGSADLAVATSGLLAEDLGGGRVRISMSLQNLGSTTATGVKAELASLQPATFDVAPVVSDGGTWTGVESARWDLGNLAPGQSKTVSVTGDSRQTRFPLVGCTLGTTPDPDPANDCASVVATLGTTPPPGPARVAVGVAPPPDATAAKGAVDVAALQFTASPPAGVTSGYLLAGVTLAVTGTGQDALDIVGVRLVPDDNGNGVVDPEEARLSFASARFDADNGVARLTFAPSDLLGGRTFLVALDFNTTVAASPTEAGFAGLSACLALCSLGAARRRRVRVAVGALALAVFVVGCGGGGGGGGTTPLPVTRTYRVSVTDLQVLVNGTAVAVTGAPVAGAEISVVK